MNIREKVLNTLWRIIDGMMILSMAVMIVLVFVNAVLRYGFQSGVLASAEISRFLFVWIILLGAIVCLRDRLHLDLRILERWLPLPYRRLQQRIIYAVIGFSSGMLFLGSARQTVDNWPNISPLSGIPVGVLYLAGAVAGGMMAVIAAFRIVFPPVEEPDETEDQEAAR